MLLELSGGKPFSWNNDTSGIITKERTEGGLNKGAHLLPLYSNHFWFFRIVLASGGINHKQPKRISQFWIRRNSQCHSHSLLIC
jgi:hypothetical protein